MSGTNLLRAFALAVSLLGILFLRILAWFTPSPLSLLYANTISAGGSPATYLNNGVSYLPFLFATFFPLSPSLSGTLYIVLYFTYFSCLLPGQ